MNKQPIKITRIEYKDSKTKMQNIVARSEWQSSFLLTNKTYADYKANSLIKKNHPELEKLFATTEMDENTPVLQIIKAMFAMDLRLNAVVKIFKFHKRTITSVFGSSVKHNNDNDLLSGEIIADISNYKRARVKYIAIKEKLAVELEKAQAEMKKAQEKVATHLIGMPNNDLKVATEGLVIAKGVGYVSGNSTKKFNLTINQVEDVFGKQAVIANREKLGLKIGTYLDFRNSGFDTKVKAKLNEAQG